MSVQARPRGRQSLSGSGDSPQLRLRIPDTLRTALDRRAAQEDITTSELARRMLTDSVARLDGDGSRVAQQRMTGPLGRRLRRRRREVLDVATAHGITNVRVFGSVARGTERPDSDLDLLVDLPPGVGLIGLGRAREAVERIVGAKVDLIPASGLKPDVAARAIAELVPL